jgi:uncharacterized protein DUF3363
LRERDLESAAVRIAKDTGLVHRPVVDGERVSGVYRRNVVLASGRFAMLGLQDFSVGDRLISQVGYHRDGVTGGAEGDDSYASFFLLASFLAFTPL